MKSRNILISGASIAGPALAYWLHRHGFHPTVVERAPDLRGGGQAIDVRGAALTVAERMGILPEVRDAHTRMRGMSFVDGEGNTLMSTTEETLTGGPTGRRATTSSTASATPSPRSRRTTAASTSPSSADRPAPSTWWWARTDCTRRCARSSSARRPASSSTSA
jgi:hypothetical protein